MRFSQVAAASLVARLAAAHGAGMEGMPKIFGMPKQLRASNPFAGIQARNAAHPAHAVTPRQTVERCGPEFGNQVCGGNDCCSSAGYCGTTQEHCQAPDCLFNFGPGCDANKTPNGESTRDIPRPQLGSIPYGGGGIYVCNNPGMVAITYDDGPYSYTESVMQQFEARGGRATFFITGNNIGKGAIDENWASVVQKMYDNGHQVASHTWSHQDLSLITREEIYDQMVKNEMAIRNILGKFPTYMRPPFSSCDAECQEVMADLGYVVSYFDLDTDDYNQLTPERIQTAKDNFKQGIDTRNDDPFDGDRLVIAHDIHELTAENLTGYMLDYLYSQGLEAVTMGECLQDPKENWYRDSTLAPANDSSINTTSPTIRSPTGPTTTDGTCGTSGSNQSCIGFVGLDGLPGECCSQYGWCGRTTDHCQTGCQAGFGKCGAEFSVSPSVSANVSTNATGPALTPAGSATTDGTCGASNNGMTCVGFVGPAGPGECCSQYGYCGNTVLHCGTGCQAGFGNCGAQNLTSSSVAGNSSTAGQISLDGTCGGQYGFTCVGFSTLAGVKSECCSAHGYCGSSADHCGAGCNPLFGNCPSVSSSSSSSAATASTTGWANSTSSLVPTPSASASNYTSTSISGHASTSASASASASAPASGIYHANFIAHQAVRLPGQQVQ